MNRSDWHLDVSGSALPVLHTERILARRISECFLRIASQWEHARGKEETRDIARLRCDRAHHARWRARSTALLELRDQPAFLRRSRFREVRHNWHKRKSAH